MNVRAEVRALRAQLAEHADPERAQVERGYHKSELDFLGTGQTPIRQTAAAFKRAHRDLSHDELIALVGALWKTRSFELRSLGLALLSRYEKLLVGDDVEFLEDLLRRGKGWAHVDWLSTSVMGPLFERTPGLKKTLRRWSRDEDFWVRRASMLVLLKPLSRGEGDFELFSRFAARMIGEKEFFIRKAIGWVLREVSKKRPQLAHAFLAEHIEQASGLTLREGSKYLPARQRDALKKRYEARKKKR